MFKRVCKQGKTNGLSKDQRGKNRKKQIEEINKVMMGKR
jgi:hypothetical protein